MIPLKPFYMIRHGESLGNKEGYITGTLDSPLTKTGIDQAQDAQKVFENLKDKPEIIVHSELSRAIKTAEIINQSANLPMYKTALLNEFYFGDWERQRVVDIRPRFYAGENPPNGESHEAFNSRVKDGLTYALELSGNIPLISCHGGIFRAFYGFYGQVTSPIENCKLYKFTPDPENTEFPWVIELIE